MNEISPVIVDPYNYDKRISAIESIELINNFCEFNNIPKPKIEIQNNSRNFGSYYMRSNKIVVNLKKSRCPVRIPGRAWSYTGYKSDLTIGGVIAHEMGHYIDYLKGRKAGYREFYSMSCKENAAEIIEMILSEPAITSYSGNGPQSHRIPETIAESMKLFILNPDLLRKGRPKAYRIMTEVYGLKPVVHKSWEEILINADVKLTNAAGNWIKQKTVKLTTEMQNELYGVREFLGHNTAKTDTESLF
jgi:hypothetical protein